MEPTPTEQYQTKPPDCEKPWRCECGRILGMVVKVDGFHKLRIPGALIRGDAEIPCPKCGKVREWHWQKATPLMETLEGRKK